ncbi:MAG: GAF domain-containing protein, partial [Chloroflexota bacterium]|nr:GAF domain-containing protein [Chloroflexota bacterium]
TRLLIAFVSLVLLTAVVTGISSTATSFQSGRTQVIAQLESVATLKEAEINTWLDSLRAELNAVLAGADAMQRAKVLLLEESPDPEGYQDAYGKLGGRLRQSVELAELYEELFLMDTRGQVIISTDTAQESKIHTAKTYFQRGLQAPYVQAPFYSPSLGHTSIIVARPVTDEQGQVLGVLAGRASMDKLSAVMNERAGLGETGETYLVGANKSLLTQLRFAETGINYARTEGINAAVDYHVNGSGLYDDYRGAPIVGAYRWLPELEVALLAEQNQSEAFRATYVTMGINLGVAILAVVIAAVVSVRVTRNIANPLADLTAMATQFTAGDLTARARATSSRDDEIGALATAFNAMAARVGELLTGLEDRGQELQARTREIEASQRVTFAASERTSPDRLLNLVVNLIRDQFHLYHAQVYIVEPPFTSPLPGGTEGGRAAVLRQSTGYAGRRLLQRKHHIPLDQPALVTRAIHTGEPVLVADVNQTQDWLPNPLLPDTQSELAVPLKVGDDVIGVLDAQSREAGRFTKETVTLFQTMADQVAFLFENSDLLARVTEQTQTLTVFTSQLRSAADIARQMGGTLDPERLLQQAVDLIRSHFGFYHVHIYTLDEAAGRLTVQAGSGAVGRVLRERGHSIPLNAKRSLVARAARDRETLLVEDTSTESDFLPNPLLPQTRSSMSAPLVAGDRVLGVLNIQDDQPGRFTETELDTFSSLAGQIAIALQNAAYFEEIQQTAEQLREMDRLKSEFMANMSHELRTPLNSIIGYAELMLMGVSEIDPETIEDVQAIYSNGRHLLGMINDILDMAKIEAGSLALSFEQVQIEPLIDEVSAQAVERMESKPIVWSAEVEPDLPPIQADPLRIGQILDKLVANAEKFTEEGEINLRVWADSRDDSDWVCIEIQDTGIGIAESDMDKVFDRFQQVDSSSTRRAGGAGLGLAITRRLVELHGGAIEVESQPGAGSTFTVRLPVKVGK